MNKPTIATVWLDGCSGCHMSLLDLDEAIVPLAAKIDLVYGPLVDAQEFPEAVDVTMVEGAVSSVDDAARIQIIRDRTRVLVAFGDCAVTGNVPAMRNTIPVEKLLRRVYIEGAQQQPQIPCDGVPSLLAHARPLHEFVHVDVHLPGCPPPANAIGSLLADLLAGRKPELNGTAKFG